MVRLGVVHAPPAGASGRLGGWPAVRASWPPGAPGGCLSSVRIHLSGKALEIVKVVVTSGGRLVVLLNASAAGRHDTIGFTRSAIAGVGGGGAAAPAGSGVGVLWSIAWLWNSVIESGRPVRVWLKSVSRM